MLDLTARYRQSSVHHEGKRKPGPTARPLSERFWEKVDTSGECWEWTGGRRPPRGYGQFFLEKREGRTVLDLAHRVSYRLNVGPIPDGMQVCHHCDNPPCVRPDHLFLGTQRDNMKDMLAKGRGATPEVRSGEDNARSKLTVADVKVIRSRREAGHSMTRIGADFGITRQNVRQICERKTWRHVP